VKTPLLAALLACGAFAAQPPASPQLLSYSKTGNHVQLRLTRGAAELEWISPSTFRFFRSWSSRAGAPAAGRDPVPVKIRDTGRDLEMESEFLVVAIAKSGLLLRARTTAGIPLATDIGELQQSGAALWWERAAPPATRYFGLGPRPDPVADARGSAIRTRTPFLISSRGYAEYHTTGGEYTFDIAKAQPDRYRIQAEDTGQIEYYVYYGPSLKEIFEQHLLVTGPVHRLTAGQLGVVPAIPLPGLLPPPPTWQALAGAVPEAVHASLSGKLFPEFDLGEYAEAQPLLRQRAEQFSDFVPVRRGGAPSEFRRRLVPFLLTYVEEARERGYPVIHPMPFQFPRDLEAARRADQFLFGDELLVAPITTPDGARSIYLPQGIWTGFDDNRVYKGRQIIEYRAAPGRIPMFCRNGTILPLAAVRTGEPMELHYFPRLGAEFFIYEPDSEEYSQVHASPAGEYVRLEIESKRGRDYEWVVHHAERPTMVSTENWRYDNANHLLRVRCRAEAGEDKIINLTMEFRPEIAKP
jgi:hypothetical protein